MPRRTAQRAGEPIDGVQPPASYETIPEWASHPDLDPMLGDWIRIAGLAWQGFLLEGLGTLVVRIHPCGISYEFRSSAVPQCCAAYVQSYDPEDEIVVVVQRGDDERAYLVAGWPSPPQAFALLPADATGETVH